MLQSYKMTGRAINLGVGSQRVQPELDFSVAPREAWALRRDACPPDRHQERQAQKRERKRQLREQREAALGAATAAAAEALASGLLYDVIYADPPWRFEPYSRRTGMDRAADNQYPTMTLDDIKKIKVPAAKNCVLFLWATSPMLPQALDVMAAWGFTYKTNMAWAKDRIGTGYWFRNRSELLLVGTKGTVPEPALNDQPPSVIDAKRGAHSVKPDVFAEMIELMFPTLDKLEMFARGPRIGWTVWGNAVWRRPSIPSPSRKSSDAKRRATKRAGRLTSEELKCIACEQNPEPRPP